MEMNQYYNRICFTSTHFDSFLEKFVEKNKKLSQC